MDASTMLRAGAILGGIAVAAGAFGAHGLKDMLVESGRLDTFETAVRYQMWHALALLLCSTLQQRGRRTAVAAWLFALGTVIFSGTLYALCLSGITWLGAITPIGGVLMIAGWIALALSRPQA